MSLNLPVRGNRRLADVLERVNSSSALQAYWDASNVTAIGRMRINDHGPVHIKIMPRNAKGKEAEGYMA